MSNITYRLVKGRELTFEEIDQNFSSLDSDIRANRRYFDSQLEVFGLGRDSDFLAVLAQRDSDAAAIILSGIARHDSDIGALHNRIDSEHAWNVSENSSLESDLTVAIDSIQQYFNVQISSSDSGLDSEHAWNVREHDSLQLNIDSVNTSLHDQIAIVNGSIVNLQTNIDSVNSSLNLHMDSITGQINTISGDITTISNTISSGSVTLSNSFTVQGTTFDGSTDQSISFSAGTGLTLVGTQFTNTAPDQTVSLTGSGATTVTGTYPNFTISSTDTDTNTTYTAGNGLSLVGTELKMSGSYTGTFTATGDVVAYSDVALKSEVNAIDQALEKLMAITGYTYKKEGSDRRYSGVMAQDVEKVLPEVVHTSEEGIKGVAYGNMMGLVIEAIRELKTQVEELKSR